MTVVMQSSHPDPETIMTLATRPPGDENALLPVIDSSVGNTLPAIPVANAAEPFMTTAITLTTRRQTPTIQYFCQHRDRSRLTNTNKGIPWTLLFATA